MKKQRNKAALIEKITIRGILRLESPLRIGSGEQGAKEADLYVLKDSGNRPFIPGSSLAGVLRSAFGRKELSKYIFGSEHLGEKGKEQILQSSLSVRDVSLSHAEIILRDSVCIDTATGVAKRGAKFNYEAVAPGTEGKIFLTLTLRELHSEKKVAIEKAVAELAEELACGIRLGSLTTKGFGRASCREVSICRYDFTKPAAVKAWLLGNPTDETVISCEKRAHPPEDFVAEANFSLNGSLLVRQVPEEFVGEMQLVSQQMEGKKSDGTPCFVLPGSGVKGVLRHQAERILQLLNRKTAEERLSSLMGGPAKTKSRFIVEESFIEKEHVLQKFQTRNRIDRFTGGTISGALFTERPIWQISSWLEGEGKPWQREELPPILRLRFCIKNCQHWEAGLALFLLRDLSLGRIALGGGKAVGRGTLTGCGATISYERDTWELDRTGRVLGENAEALAKKLQDYGHALMEE